MAQRLETLQPGTAVYCGDLRVGEVRGVYAEGDANVAEYLAVLWASRDEVVLVPTNDVDTIDVRGVVLMSADPAAYEGLGRFDEEHMTRVHRLR